MRVSVCRNPLGRWVLDVHSCAPTLSLSLSHTHTHTHRQHLLLALPTAVHHASQFASVFGVERGAYAQLPQWKRLQLKRSVQLF
jgi:Villin headpiece domain